MRTVHHVGVALLLGGVTVGRKNKLYRYYRYYKCYRVILILPIIPITTYIIRFPIYRQHCEERSSGIQYGRLFLLEALGFEPDFAAIGSNEERTRIFSRYMSDDVDAAEVGDTLSTAARITN